MTEYAHNLFKVSLACSLLMMTVHAYSLIIEEILYLNSQDIPVKLLLKPLPDL